MKTTIVAGVMIALGLAATTARAGARDDDEDEPAVVDDDRGDRGDEAAQAALARIERREPSVRDAVAAALRHAGLDAHPETALRRRARAAAMLPTLMLRASRDTSWDDPAGDARLTGDVGHRELIEARATWRLDRLVYDGSEPRLAALAQQRARARAALAAQTSALYYKRRAAQVDLLWHPPGSVEESVRAELAIDELTAELDALTGGWWSAEAAR